MTPQQAINHLLQAARLAPLTYQQHATTDAAYQLLAKRLEELEAEVNRLAEAKPAACSTGDRSDGWKQFGSGQVSGTSADGFNSHTDV